MVTKTVLFLMFNLVSFAETKIRVSDNRVSLGDTFDLDIVSDEEYEVEGLDDFNVVSESIGQSMSFVNGSMTFTKRKNLILAPIKLGTFGLKVKGTNTEVIIRVEDSGKTPQSFIDVKVDSVEVYKNQKFVVKYYLLSKRDVASAIFRPILDFGSFDFKIYDLSEDIEEKMIGIERYNIWSIDQMSCSSKDIGALKLLSRVMDVRILNSKSFYGKFISTQLSSGEKRIVVKELPNEDVEIVGDLNLKFESDDVDIDSNDSFSVRFEFFGDVNIDSLSNIYGKIDGCKVFENIVEHKEDIVDGKYYANKKIEVIFSPIRGGKLNIPPVKIRYFDYRNEEYKEITLPDFELNVNEIKREIVNVVVDEKRIGFFELWNRYRYLLYILVIILLYLLVKRFTFLFFKSNFRDSILKIAKSKDKKEVLDLLSLFILKEKGLDILKMSKKEILKSFPKLGKDIVKIKDSVDSLIIFGQNDKLDVKSRSISVIKRFE